MPAPRVILITGATRGLGRAMSAEFASRGHTVLGCGTSPGPLAEAIATLGSPHRFDNVDVTDYSAVSDWVQELRPEFGPPDLVLNNAAIINPNAPLWDIPAADFDRLMAVNVSGTANVIRAVLPSMIERGSGVIVNFSSGWGRSTSPEVAPYCASKWAIEGLTQALAQELPPGLAAVPLNPGIINTDLLRSCFAEAAESFPTATQWATRAVPFLLNLGPKDNGRPLSAP